MANLAEPASPASERPVATVQGPIDLNTWIEENRPLFKPPVSNRYIYDGRDFFVMIIMGPNARNDFHRVDSEEYFYQLKGDIKVRIREGDRINCGVLGYGAADRRVHGRRLRRRSHALTLARDRT